MTTTIYTCRRLVLLMWLLLLGMPNAIASSQASEPYEVVVHPGSVRVTYSISTASEPYEVVVHPGVSEQSLSRNSLRAIFGMHLKTWPDGTPIRVFVLPDDAPLHNAFCKEKLNVFPYQLRSAWDRLVFSGTGQAPITVSSGDEMLARVAGTPGAIGYLTRAKINDSVRILQIK